MNTNTQTKGRTLFLLIMLISIAQCGLSLCLPSLPSISQDFNASPALIQLTVTYYLIGIGVSQLFYGPLSDHYGRKKTALVGIYIFLLGLITSISAETPYMLLMARLLQGLGIGCSTVISRAVLRDVFQGKEYTKAGSQLAGAVAIAPIVAPILGAYLQIDFGWRAIFYTLLAITLIILVCWHTMFRETCSSSSIRKNITVSLVLTNYLSIIKSKVFIKNVVCGSLIYSCEIVFLLITPFLIQVQLGFSALIYGWFLIITVLGYLSGTTMSSYLSYKLTCEKLVIIGVSFSSLASLMMLIFVFLDYSNLFSLGFPLILFMFGAGFVYPNTSLSAIEQFSDKAGTASALFSSIQGAIAASVGTLTSILYSNSLLTMACSLIILCSLAWLCFVFIFGLDDSKCMDRFEAE